MIRPMVGLLGIVTALVPDRILEAYETFAIENPDEQSLRSGVSRGIRGEGAVVTVLSLLGGRGFAWMMNVTGAFGAFVLLFPERYQRLAARLLYENPEDVKWNDRFADGVRVIGVLYVFLALREFQKRRLAD